MDEMKSKSTDELYRMIDSLQKKNRRIGRFQLALFMILGALVGMIVLLLIIGFVEGYF